LEKILAVQLAEKLDLFFVLIKEAILGKMIRRVGLNFGFLAELFVPLRHLSTPGPTLGKEGMYDRMNDQCKTAVFMREQIT
jgi:hypothetical protein